MNGSLHGNGVIYTALLLNEKLGGSCKTSQFLSVFPTRSVHTLNLIAEGGEYGRANPVGRIRPAGGGKVTQLQGAEVGMEVDPRNASTPFDRLSLGVINH